MNMARSLGINTRLCLASSSDCGWLPARTHNHQSASPRCPATNRPRHRLIPRRSGSDQVMPNPSRAVRPAPPIRRTRRPIPRPAAVAPTRIQARPLSTRPAPDPARGARPCLRRIRTLAWPELRGRDRGRSAAAGKLDTLSSGMDVQSSSGQAARHRHRCHSELLRQSGICGRCGSGRQRCRHPVFGRSPHGP